MVVALFSNIDELDSNETCPQATGLMSQGEEGTVFGPLQERDPPQGMGARTFAHLL